MWILLACGGPSEAERFAAAVDPEVALQAALDGCAELQPGRAGECATAALESRSAMSLEACRELSEPLWQDECTFQLAEQLAETDLRAGIETCHASQFARECSFHLIRAQARTLASSEPTAAEAGVGNLHDIPRAPDASVLFYEEWHLASRKAGIDASYARCSPLLDERPCVEGLRRLSHKTLRAKGPPGCDAVALDVVDQGGDNTGALVPNDEILAELVDLCRSWH
ncbi:MAG: hypothetical protein GY913_32415 [Proteobacteria bacterium]|nr:hypothetical protein [Pseudomonadota bacterium]MCP4921626.1 hypothetical protein [Pseudomonadota bacterium]